MANARFAAVSILFCDEVDVIALDAISALRFRGYGRTIGWSDLWLGVVFFPVDLDVRQEPVIKSRFV